MRFTVRGTKHGLPVEVSWDEGVVDGDPEVMSALLELATPRVGKPGVVRPPVHQAGIVIAGLTEPIPFLQAVQRTLDDIDEIDTSDGQEPMRLVSVGRTEPNRRPVRPDPLNKRPIQKDESYRAHTAIS